MNQNKAGLLKAQNKLVFFLDRDCRDGGKNIHKSQQLICKGSNVEQSRVLISCSVYIFDILRVIKRIFLIFWGFFYIQKNKCKFTTFIKTKTNSSTFTHICIPTEAEIFLTVSNISLSNVRTDVYLRIVQNVGIEYFASELRIVSGCL